MAAPENPVVGVFDRAAATYDRVGASTFGPFDAAWQQVDAVLTPHRGPNVPDPRAVGAESPFASDAGVEGLFVAAGFEDAVTQTSVVDVRFRDEDHWYEWSWSVGQRGMWERIPEEDRPGVRALAVERMQDCRDAHGRIGFSQTVRFTLGRRGRPRSG